MRYNQLFAWCALAVGMALPGASVVSAADWDGRLRNDIARDRARLNEDIRCGRRGAAAADARDLARDQRALHARRDWR